MSEKKSRSFTSKLIRIIWITFLSGVLFMVLFFTAISLGWLGFMPDIEELENPKSNLASIIYSSDQEELGKYYIQNRANIKYHELPKELVDAAVATEDARFYQHSGIDLRGLVRVVVFAGSKGGGSTITQQLAKNMFPRDILSKPELIIRKFKEWVIAVKLEYNYTKEEIVAMYFNQVAFGMNNFGIETAAKTYFGKEPIDLKIEESAVLVGMLKAPSAYNPILHYDSAKHRRNVVLNQMVKYNYLDRESYDSLKTLEIDVSKYRRLDHNEGLATYFREYLRGELKDWCANHYKPNGEPYNLYKDGLRIYTTINSKMQAYAEEAVKEHLGGELQEDFFNHWKNRKKAPFWNISKKQYDRILSQAKKRSERYRRLKRKKATDAEIDTAFNTPTEMQVFSWDGYIDTIMTPIDSILYYKHFLNVGMMSVEPHTGYVRAYVGGIDYRHFKYDHVMQGRRQVGSTFKPFVYASAFQELGYGPCTMAPNVPVTFEMPDGQPDWTPKNSDDKREGEMVSLKWALANSVNYISAFLMKRVKPQKVIELARKMGIESDIPAVPAICLGTPSLKVYEMVGALSTFANKGVYNKPVFLTRIEDKNGNVIEQFRGEQTDAMSEETAYRLLELLKGVVETGTGRRIIFRYKLNNPIAGKTGTTDNQSDGWFMGLTPDLVTGVWVGNEDRSAHFRTIRLGQGANMALPIWGLYMQKVYADESLDVSQGDFEAPDGYQIETDCIEETQEIDGSNNSTDEDSNDLNITF